ncbi:MAG: toll/interleukin-1 receptor domain-containing protein [Actinomycetota bacterium]
MARVFVSYRRADGRLGVDWIAERLGQLDAIDGVETAFHDVGLRAGDHFPTALETEIADCEIVVAVIGPNWEGRREDGTARIRDADDWVVREIDAAFRQEKIIIPVMIDDAMIPAAADLHPSIDALGEYHGLPLQSGEHLDEIVEHIADHLAEKDRDAATRAGLENPIVVPQLAALRLLIPMIVLGALVGGGLAALSAFAGTGDTVFVDRGRYDVYGSILILYGAFAGATIPVGILISWRIVRQSYVDWRNLAIGALVVTAVPALMTVLTGSSHGILREASSAIDLGAARSWGNLGAIVVTLACWVIPAGAGMYARPRVGEHEIGGRVAHLAVLRDAERWTILVAAGILTMGTAVGIALEVVQEDFQCEAGACGPLMDQAALVAVALILSAVVIMVHRWAITAMAETQAAISRAAAGLPEPYASHATGQLAAEPLADGGWGFRIALAMPAIVAIAGVVLATVVRG